MLLFIFDSNYLCLLLLAINSVIPIIWCKPCIVSVPDKAISHCWYLTRQFWLTFDTWKIYILYHGAWKIDFCFCSVKFWKDNQKQHTLLNIPASPPQNKIKQHIKQYHHGEDRKVRFIHHDCRSAAEEMKSICLLIDICRKISGHFKWEMD